MEQEPVLLSLGLGVTGQAGWRCGTQLVPQPIHPAVLLHQAGAAATLKGFLIILWIFKFIPALCFRPPLHLLPTPVLG